MIKLKKISFKNTSFGMKSYDLLDISTGESVPSYAEFLHEIMANQVSENRQAQNSINAVASDLKVFLEYVLNAQDLLFKNKVSTETTYLSEIILSYPSYLSLAQNSQSKLARETAKITNRAPVKGKSVARNLSTVNKFLNASAANHERNSQANTLDFINIDVASKNIHKDLLNRRKLSTSERIRLQKDSVIGQVIRGGARYTNSILFRTPSRISSTSSKDYKHFPIDYIQPLLDNAQTYRDRALWSLLLGTGLRMSEAGQILVQDIDLAKEEVKILSYRHRIACFEGLNDKSIFNLSFKGRATEEVFFIYPFKTVFFDSIEKYLKFERPYGAKHSYLFVTNGNRSKGEPLFSSSNTTQNYSFKKVQNKISCPYKDGLNKRYTLHSLRHFYGHWLINFHRTETGEKLNIEDVQYMMGHKERKSTEHYAVINKEIAKEKMRLANLVLQNKYRENSKEFLTNQQNNVLTTLLKGVSL